MSGRRIKRPRQRANASPGLVSEPEKEAPLTDTIIPQSESASSSAAANSARTPFPENILLHSRDGLLEVAHGLCLPGAVGPVLYVRGAKLSEAQREAESLRGENRLLADDNLRLLDLTRSLAARVRLLEDAVLRDDKPALIRHHVARLAEMVREGE